MLFLFVGSSTGDCGDDLTTLDCQTGKNINCNGDASYSIERSSHSGCCVKFTDIQGPCTLELSAKTSTSGSACWFPQNHDLQIAAYKQGGNKIIVTEANNPSLSFEIPEGYDELVLFNDHVNHPQFCVTDVADLHYCCKQTGNDTVVI